MRSTKCCLFNCVFKFNIIYMSFMVEDHQPEHVAAVVPAFFRLNIHVLQTCRSQLQWLQGALVLSCNAFLPDVYVRH